MGSQVLYATLVVCLAAVCYARMAYQFPGGADALLPNVQTTFSCEGRIYGYYADQDNACQVFHVCLPVYDDQDQLLETAHFSFLCGNQTIFSQDTLGCAHIDDAFPCDQAASLYDSVNAEFGKIPERRL